MKKKHLVWMLAFASAYLCSCSDDNATAPFGNAAQITESSTSTDPLDDPNNSGILPPLDESSASTVNPADSSKQVSPSTANRALPRPPRVLPRQHRLRQTHQVPQTHQRAVRRHRNKFRQQSRPVPKPIRTPP